MNNNALGSSVSALGSSITISNVRRRDATTFVVASLIALFSIFLFPHACLAQSASPVLYWGTYHYDINGNYVSDDLLSIENGGTYSVPLNTQKTVFVQDNPNWWVFGDLYLLSDATSTRTFVGSFGNGVDTLAWSKPGHYELDIYPSDNGPVLGDSLWQKIQDMLFIHTAYAQTAGDPIDKIFFTITDENVTPVCTTDCNSNVLFLPGIEASRLYRPARPDETGLTEKRLWEPDSDADAMQLAMTPQGTSVRGDIYTKGILDEAYVLDAGPNIYKSFISDMNNLKSSGKIQDWAPVPYDWRLSLDDILAGGTKTGDAISYSSPSSEPFILSELKRLAATSRTGKVTIVAHSNGGLVAKELMLRLGASTTASLIDKVIFVAVPQIGTPAALGALLHGYDQGIPLGKVSEATMRTLGNHSPSAYNLLPSQNYFTYVDDPVATFDAATLPDWSSRYGSLIHSAPTLHTFLTDSYGRVSATSTDTIDPVALDSTLLTQAENVHAALDSWTPPAGVQLIQIAGWGIPTTLKGIEYASTTKPIFCISLCQKGGLGFTASTTIDGDGTVTVPSALWTSTTTGAVNYWVDIGSYNLQDRPVANSLGLGNRHKDILEIPTLLSFISDFIVNSFSSTSLYTFISTQAPAAIGSRLRFSLHSPLTLNLYDDQGRHTGISTTTGQVEEQIPGTYYSEFGEVKYMFTDASSSAHIVMSGYASGTFTFNVDQYTGDTLTASTTFKDIPTSTTTTVSLAVQSNISTLSPMSIDKNGDGTPDAVIVPKLGGTVTLDTTPPEFRIAFATSTNALLITAMDDMGTTTIVATTSYPVLKKGQKDYKGVATTTVIARDAAGNTTSLVYTEQLPSPTLRDTISLQFLAYNGATTTIASTSVSYKWRTNTDASYKLFASFIRTAATSTESHFRPKKGLTIIMTKPVDIDDADTDDDVDVRPTKTTVPGLVVPYMRTEKGRLITNY